jgi:glutaminyl-peptide cyclotransferase
VIDAGKAFAGMEKLALTTPRFSGSEGAAKAASMLADAARAAGASGVETQEFQADSPAGKTVFRNVIACVPGKSRDFAVIGGHYDSKKIDSAPNFQGANDSGSSTGVMLAMAEAAAKSPDKPPLSLRFVFFDGEECLYEYGPNDGLHGSRHYAESLKRSGELKMCRAVIVLDMVGDKDLKIAPPVNSTGWLRDRLFKCAAELGNSGFFVESKASILDDHQPFLDAGLPALDVIDFDYGPSNSYWHTSADSVDKIDPKSLKITGDTVLRLLWSL